jgi:maltose alpha-D-glucosyltransferase/alpha-amylase
MLEVRRAHPVFGTGSMEVVSTDNPSVLAYVRASAATVTVPGAGPDVAGGPRAPEQALVHGDWVLCVSNLSRFAQPAQLPLQRWEGMTPVELLGRVPFPPIGELPYFITLPPYGFYWFGLVERHPSSTGG